MTPFDGRSLWQLAAARPDPGAAFLALLAETNQPAATAVARLVPGLAAVTDPDDDRLALAASYGATWHVHTSIADETARRSIESTRQRIIDRWRRAVGETELTVRQARAARALIDQGVPPLPHWKAQLAEVKTR